jgi:hypothetical protein
METELKALEKELQENYTLPDTDHELHSPRELDQFTPIMHQFFKDASAEFKRVCNLFNKMDESYDQVVRFYGEDPKKMQPDEFFGIFHLFTMSWEVSRETIHSRATILIVIYAIEMLCRFKGDSNETRTSRKAKETRP